MLECCKLFVFVIYLFSLLRGCYGDNASRGRKCTIDDPRSPLPCWWNATGKVLRCDRSNLFQIPHPGKNSKNNLDAESGFTPSPENFEAEYLYMNDSCLKDVDPEILQNYSLLKEINFSDNLIQSIEDGTFQNMTMLKRLDLSYNNITFISQNTFRGATSLQELDLMHNNIEKIHKEAFTSLLHLQRLHLDWNKLQSTDFLDHVSQLTVLSLQNNFINMWIKSRSGQFKTLTSISLASNCIKSLGKGNFTNFQQLQILNLRNNTISVIEGDTFDLADSLKYVDLRDNQIKVLKPNLFKNLCDLRVLRLSGNHLSTAYPEWFVSVLLNNRVPVKSSSPLEKNKWKCDCAMEKYLNFLRFLNSTDRYRSRGWTHYFDLDCRLPSKLGRKSLLMNNDITGNCHTSFKTNEDYSGTIEQLPVFMTSNCHSIFDILPPIPEQSRLSRQIFPYMSLATLAVLAVMILAVLATALHFCLKKYPSKSTQVDLPRISTLTAEPPLLPSCRESYCSVVRPTDRQNNGAEISNRCMYFNCTDHSQCRFISGGNCDRGVRVIEEADYMNRWQFKRPLEAANR